MTAKPDNEKEPGASQETPANDVEPRNAAARKVRIITAKDVGWVTPTGFVAPVTLVPIDPPRPIKKRPRRP